MRCMRCMRCMQRRVPAACVRCSACASAQCTCLQANRFDETLCGTDTARPARHGAAHSSQAKQLRMQCVCSERVARVQQRVRSACAARVQRVYSACACAVHVPWVCLCSA